MYKVNDILVAYWQYVRNACEWLVSGTLVYIVQVVEYITRTVQRLAREVRG